MASKYKKVLAPELVVALIPQAKHRTANFVNSSHHKPFLLLVPFFREILSEVIVAFICV